MYSNFYLDKKTFTKSNLDIVGEYILYFLRKWRDDCIAINVNQEDLKYIYEKLKEEKVDQSILDNIFKFLKVFRGSKIVNFNKNIQNYDDLENLHNELKINCELLVLNNKVLEEILESDFKNKSIFEIEDVFDKFDKEYFPIRCISNFDRFKYFKSGSLRMREGKNKISFFVNNYIYPLIMSSKQIDILDQYCLVNIIKKNDLQISGIENFISQLINSPVKRLTIISGISKEDINNTEKNINSEKIFDEFEKICNKYSKKNKIDHNTEINLIIANAEIFKDLDRIIFFDNHSVIDIHGISVLNTTRDDFFKKSVTCHRYKDIKNRSVDFNEAKRKATNNPLAIKQFYLF